MARPTNPTPRPNAAAGVFTAPLAQRVAGNLVQNRVLLGRFRLVIKRTESYQNCGASSVIHYASLELGLEERESREVLLVAQRLESLPALTDAVERNLLSWCKLRALLRQATPEYQTAVPGAKPWNGCWRPRQAGAAGLAARTKNPG